MLEKLVATSYSNSNSESNTEYADATIGYDSFTFCCASVPGLQSDNNYSASEIGEKITEALNGFYKDLNNEHIIGDFVNDGHKQRMHSREFFRKLDSECREYIKDCDDYSVVAGIMSPRVAFIIVRGNSRCVVFDVKGASFDVIQKAQDSDGILSGDKFEDWKYAVVDTHNGPLIGAFGCSPGFNKNFAGFEQQLHFLRDTIIFACKNNVEILSSYLDKSFIQMSRHANADVSLIGFLSVEHLTSFVNRFIRLNKSTGVKVEMKQVDKRIDALKEVDVDDIKKRLNAAKEAYTIAFREYDEAQKVFDEVFERTGKQAFFSMISIKLGNKDIVDEETAEKNLQAAELKMNKLLQEYELVQTEYDEYFAKMNDLKDQKRDLGRKMRHNNYKYS